MATKSTAAPAPEPETRPGRGGWRGGGRPKAAPDELLVAVSMRFTVNQREKLTALGGVAWIREKIDRTKPEKAPAAPEPVRRHGAEPDEVYHVMPMRLTAGQREKLAELGGAAWLRERINLARIPK